MKVTPQKTEFEVGDPVCLSLRIAKCPCGRDLAGDHSVTYGGHVRLPFCQQVASYGACSVHFNSMASTLVQKTSGGGMGYRGEWEPRLGLDVEIAFATEEGSRYETVPLLPRPEPKE